MINTLKKISLIFTIFLSACGTLNTNQTTKTQVNHAAQKPNIIIVFTDDQGFQDLSSYGSPLIKTPNLDKMAKQGARFNNFYVASSVCSASRASLLTGRLGARNGTTGVYFPDSKGLNPDEITLAEMLKKSGYSTAMYGKWHLGDFEASLPIAQGFDEYFGVPYSNDMYIGSKQKLAENIKLNLNYNLEKIKSDQVFVEKNRKKRANIKKAGIKELVPLMEGNLIVEYPAEQSSLTQRFFDRAISFIEQQDEKPFFIYLTPAMPHVPLFTSEQFKGKSARGLYGDVIEEIDWHMGRLTKHLERNNLADNTLIIFASDNGPWLGYKDHAGSAGHLRDGKFTNFEGGVRVPGIFYWPNRIKPNSNSQQLASSLDLMPTLAYFAKAELPNVKIDGINLAPHLLNPKESIERSIIYSSSKMIAGIREGDWKYIRKGGVNLRKHKSNNQAYLFNLAYDEAEQVNLISKHPDIVNQLEAKIKTIEADIN